MVETLWFIGSVLVIVAVFALVFLVPAVIIHRIICAWCKRDMGPVYDTDGDSHGICPECANEYFSVEVEK